MSDAGVKRRVAIISGYYCPVHSGHVEYAKLAKEFVGDAGFVYCIVNNDEQAIMKKGYAFIPEADRVSIMGALKYVDLVVLSIDRDRTVCETIRDIAGGYGPKPTHFLKGGDVTSDTRCPEVDVCEELGIEVLYGFGDKIQSSSWILEKSVKEAYEQMFGGKI